MAPRLTIVLPLRGRHLFTFRFLWHANKMRLPYRFLLADGKVHGAVARRLESSRNDFPNLDIEYVRYPDDAGYSQFFAKMSDVLKRVRTPYVMLADNDDFLGFDGIERALEFLDANVDYICARGHSLNFSIYSGSGNAYGGVYGKFNCFYMQREFKTVPSATARERLYHGGLCHSVYYAVFRTAAPVCIWHEIAEIDFSDLMLYEDYFALRALTLGKVHTHEDTVSYYSQAATSITHDPLRDWASHLLRSRFTSDAHAMVERISSAAAEADGDNAATIAENVRTTLERRYRDFLSMSYGSVARIKRYIRKKWPRFVMLAQNRPRFSIRRERAAAFSKLRDGGASRERLERIRRELAMIETALSAESFAEYAGPLLSMARADNSREWF